MNLKPTYKLINGLKQKGYAVIAGVDEVGRGCWAGPVVAAAVILPDQVELKGVRDSKLLTSLQRQQLSAEIKRQALAIGIGWASSAEVDKSGLSWAICASGQRALEALSLPYDAVLLDGNHNYLKDFCYAEAVIKADQKCIAVASASIIAKVARDNFMARLHYKYPQYGFDSHKGYGTQRHLEAIQSGISPVHRRLFAPVKLAEALSVN